MASMSPVMDRQTDTVEALDEPWVVLLHNDPVNTRNYVTMVICKVFGYTEQKAARLMMEADSNGRTAVWSGARDEGAIHVEALHSYTLNASLVCDR